MIEFIFVRDVLVNVPLIVRITDEKTTAPMSFLTGAVSITEVDLS